MNRNQRKQIRNTLKMERCRYCLATEYLTIDHKIPLIQGGTDKLSNLQCLCKRCNTIKSGLSHNQVKALWSWCAEVQEARLLKGKKLYTKKWKEFTKDLFK